MAFDKKIILNEIMNSSKWKVKDDTVISENNLYFYYKREMLHNEYHYKFFVNKPSHKDIIGSGKENILASFYTKNSVINNILNLIKFHVKYEIQRKAYIVINEYMRSNNLGDEFSNFQINSYSDIKLGNKLIDLHLTNMKKLIYKTMKPGGFFYVDNNESIIEMSDGIYIMDVIKFGKVNFFTQHEIIQAHSYFS